MAGGAAKSSGHPTIRLGNLSGDGFKYARGLARVKAEESA